MCVPGLLGRFDGPRPEPWQLAFLPQLSLRLEDFDHRQTGLCHCNPRADPYPSAEWSASGQALLEGSLHRPLSTPGRL